MIPWPETPEDDSPYTADYRSGGEAMQEQEKRLLDDSLESRDSAKVSEASETPFLGGIKPQKFRIIFAGM